MSKTLYEKIIKRELRKSGLFDEREINIVGLKSKTLDFSLDVIKKVLEKSNLNKKLNLEVYDSISDIKMNNDKRYLLILPIEGVLLSFFIYFYTKEESYKKYIKKSDINFYNIAYEISEYYLSGFETVFDKRYEHLSRFVYSLIKINEKYTRGSARLLEEIGKFLDQ